MKIRLTDDEIEAIKSLTKEIFGDNSKVWIFGSRVDTNLKGGDIDIYIEAENLDDLFEKKLDFLVKLKDKIGDQKIDLIVKSLDSQDPISLKIKEKAIQL